MMITRALALLMMSALLGSARASDDWPQFRGPLGNGQSDAQGLPTTWSETNGVRWKTAIPGKAWASPVIADGKVWLANATEDGKQLSVVCVNQETGSVERDEKLFDVEAPQFCHKFNSYASPTPVIEKGRLYITFGSPGTACVDTTSGKKLWERRDLECNHYRSAGSSPILFQGLLIMHFDGSDKQYLVALDKLTGKTVWLVNRSIDYKDLGPDGKPQIEGDLRKAFSTPHVASIDGAATLLSLGAKAAYAYEPLTGKEIWRVEERANHSASTRPVFGNGLVYAPSGFASGQLLAIRPGKPGEVIDANEPNPQGKQLQIVWKTKRNVPKKPSLILLNDLLFMIDDGGIASCLDAKTGAEHWRERASGNYSASPLYADGRVYFFSEEGKTTVVRAAKDYEKIAENQLGDGFMASPAVASKALFLRSRTHLYRIEQ
jgi:outer membrane protein assembly factor BamB